jgi:hypothetical protein
MLEHHQDSVGVNAACLAEQNPSLFGDQATVRVAPNRLKGVANALGILRQNMQDENRRWRLHSLFGRKFGWRTPIKRHGDKVADYVVYQGAQKLRVKEQVFHVFSSNGVLGEMTSIGSVVTILPSANWMRMTLLPR